MADKKGKNGPVAAAAQPAAPDQQMQIQVVGQYIKDLSFENPNVEKLVDGIGEQPNLNVEVSVNARPVNEAKGLYESQIDFKAVAVNKIGTIYDLEIAYAGMFALRGVPAEALQPFLLINCPSILFPFLRRIIADVTREGGFPPLLLDPIDFGSLFMRRQQEMASAQSPGKLKS